jgi:hypothetical protein
MKKSINEFRSILTETEKLSTTQLCQLKGGGGEDLRRNTSVALPATASSVAVSATAKI